MLPVLLITLFLTGAESNNIPPISKAAERLHRSSIVIDGHNDLPWELRNKANSSFETIDISKDQPELDTDIPRLRKGGIGAQFWAAYVPAESSKTNGAAHLTFEQIDLIHRMVQRYPETFAFATTANEIERAFRQGKIASLIGIEGGHSIENSLPLLRIYHRLGVRYLTLTHSDSIDWADAATDLAKVGGLNQFGREVIHEMNRLGMMVDISHVSVATMCAALDVSSAPVIASHSCADSVAPHARNVPDDVLLRLKKNGGLVMVNFFSGFVVRESAKILERMFDVSREIRARYPDPADARTALQAWRKDHPIPPGTVKDLVDHIDHIVKIAGVDHVGLGSDYDGVPTFPRELPDVSSYPVITQELLNRGYSKKEIRKILGENLLRVMREVESVARALQKSARN